jgi:hypothetical protein
MSAGEDLFYRTPNSAAFYRDCIAHAVGFALDKMPDRSWRRVCSDHPLAWVLENVASVTSHFMALRHHALEEQNERWGSEKHLEVNVELRAAGDTYIFSVEMDSDHLPYFVERYALTVRQDR